MPFYDESDKKPFSNAMECLEFAEQVLLVSLSTHIPYISLTTQFPGQLMQALSFLHNNQIAHLVSSTPSDFGPYGPHCLLCISISHTKIF
jgi:hypothetical protein